MKNTILKITGFFALAVLLVSFTNSPKINSLKIGKKAPMTNYEMKNVSGEDYSLEKLAFENGILVIHRHKDEKDLIPDKLKVIEEKKYGLSKIIFLSIFNQ